MLKNKEHETYISYIEENKALFTDVSDKIWEYAELSLKEYKSADLYCEVLKKEGFQVEYPFAGIETAFKGTFGSGKPVIGILAEYDALSGLSQEAGVASRKELIPNGSGHGCGHNLLGAGSLAAAFAVKKYLENNPGKGTVHFYGCPGEEGGASKAFMARDGVWKELDIALTWHPSDVNQVGSGTCNSCIQTEYHFKGIASHAAGDPELGRSALDAVELMNLGVQFLREHMPDTARIHYAITDAGGVSPNVVQPHAKVLYMVRSILAKDALLLQERVDKIAQGAAMMTETKVESVFIDGCSNTVPNRILEELCDAKFNEIGVPSFTEEEMAFAKELVDSYEMANDALPGMYLNDYPELEELVKEHSENGTKPLNDFYIPYRYSNKPMMGSTDVGDVSWLVPTMQFYTACVPSKAPGHSWQNVSCGKTSIAHKGMLHAGKIMTLMAIDLYENPELIEKAWNEFRQAAKSGYYCPVPADAILKPVE